MRHSLLKQASLTAGLLAAAYYLFLRSDCHPSGADKLSVQSKNLRPKPVNDVPAGSRAQPGSKISQTEQAKLSEVAAVQDLELESDWFVPPARQLPYVQAGKRNAPARFSSMECFNEMGYLHETGPRLCLLHDVCHIKGSDSQHLVFYTDPDEGAAEEPLFYDENKMLYDFEDSEGWFTSLSVYHDMGRWTSHKELGPVPADIPYDTAPYAVIGQFAWANNFGWVGMGVIMGQGLPRSAVHCQI